MTTDWLETNRGAVARWEVDHNGHLTVAYYFERFGHATLAMLDAFGLGLAYAERERRACVTVDGTSATRASSASATSCTSRPV